jgi:hypothetical protein
LYTTSPGHELESYSFISYSVILIYSIDVSAQKMKKHFTNLKHE